MWIWGRRTFSNFITSWTFTNFLNFKLISSNFTTMDHTETKTIKVPCWENNWDWNQSVWSLTKKDYRSLNEWNVTIEQAELKVEHTELEENEDDGGQMNKPRGRSMDLLGERTTGSADLNSRNDPVTCWLAAISGLDAAARPGARSSVIDEDDDVIVTSALARWVAAAIVTGVVWRRLDLLSASCCDDDDVWCCGWIITHTHTQTHHIADEVYSIDHATPWVKKQDTKLLPITSPNVNRFSKLFRWHIQL